jgi:hypothetical protein
LVKLHKSFKQLLVIGDFNLPDLNGCFDSVLQNASEADLSFQDSANSHFLNQMNRFPSRKKSNNILDLIFTSVPEKFGDVVESSEHFHTDHKLLEFSIAVRIGRLKNEPRYNFKAANFDSVRAELDNTDFGEVFSASDANSSWNVFSRIFTSVLDVHIPKVKIKDVSAPAWIDAEVRHHQNKKETAWRRAKKTNLPKHWAYFRKLRNQLKNLLTVKFSEYINSMGATIVDNPKRFWSYIRSKTKSKSLPKVIHSSGFSATSAKDQAINSF